MCYYQNFYNEKLVNIRITLKTISIESCKRFYCIVWKFFIQLALNFKKIYNGTDFFFLNWW